MSRRASRCPDPRAALTTLQQAHFETVLELQDAAERATAAETLAQECWEGWHAAAPEAAEAWRVTRGAALGVEPLKPRTGSRQRLALLCGRCARPVQPLPGGEWGCAHCEPSRKETR